VRTLIEFSLSIADKETVGLIPVTRIGYTTLELNTISDDFAPRDFVISYLSQ